MDDYIKLLKNEMKLLEDKDKVQELRQDLKIENLDKKELLKYEIDFLAKNLGHKNLNCMDKSDYFQELIKNCIDMKKARTLFEFAKITCVEKDSNIKILCVLTDKEDGAKIIYSISDNEEITQVTQDNIRKKFKEGMRTLSKSREEKFKGILLGKQERCLKKQERPQFFGTYSKMDKAYLEENKVFSVQEIGKSTINVPTENKDKARSRVQREQQKLVEANREQFE